MGVTCVERCAFSGLHTVFALIDYLVVIVLQCVLLAEYRMWL